MILPAAALIAAILAAAPAAAPAPDTGPVPEGWILLRLEDGVIAVRADGGRIVPGEEGRRAAVSPSSRYRAHLIQTPAGRARLLVRRNTGGLVADTWVGPGLLAWSPDDRHLVVRTVADDGLTLLETESGTWRRLTADSGGLWDAEVAWAPDATRLGIISRAPGRRAATIVGLDGSRIDLAVLGTPASIVWMPDGRLLVAADDDDTARVCAVAADGTISVLALESGVRFLLPLPLAEGVLMVQRSNRGDRVLVAETEALRAVSPAFVRVEAVEPHPDRRAAAFLVEGRRGPEVWVLAPRRPARRIWMGEGRAEVLAWTVEEPPEPRGLTDYNYVRTQ